MPFTYPTAAEVRALEPDLIARGAAGRVGFQIFPFRPVNMHKVRFTQMDNFYGLQQLRGLDGQPTHVVRIGQRTFEYEPGVFGEYIDVTETELTTRAGSVDVLTTNIDVSDIVLEADQLLINRELDRMESTIWTLLTEGAIEINLPGPAGQTGWRAEYDTQEFTSIQPWSDADLGTPLADFIEVAMLGVGARVNLGGGARAYMNSRTASYVLLNRNDADLGGRLVGGGNTINTLADTNRILMANSLPQIVIYDEGYIPVIGGDLTDFIRFIPDDIVVVIGNRPSGARTGEYLLTRNASNGFRPGSYRYLIDRANGVNADKRTPANLEVHRGHNGGPAIYYPSAVVVMNVGE